MVTVRRIILNELVLRKFGFPERCLCETRGKHCVEPQIRDGFSSICCQMAADHHMSKYNDIWKV